MEMKSYVTDNGDRITFMRNGNEINIQVTSYKIGKVNFTLRDKKQMKAIVGIFTEAMK